MNNVCIWRYRVRRSNRLSRIMRKKKERKKNSLRNAFMYRWIVRSSGDRLNWRYDWPAISLESRYRDIKAPSDIHRLCRLHACSIIRISSEFEIKRRIDERVDNWQSIAFYSAVLRSKTRNRGSDFSFRPCVIEVTWIQLSILIRLIWYVGAYNSDFERPFIFRRGAMNQFHEMEERYFSRFF